MSVKGSWNRVKDQKSYNDNWDKIFGKPEEVEEMPKEDEQEETKNEDTE